MPEVLSLFLCPLLLPSCSPALLGYHSRANKHTKFFRCSIVVLSQFFHSLPMLYPCFLKKSLQILLLFWQHVCVWSSNGFVILIGRGGNMGGGEIRQPLKVHFAVSRQWIYSCVSAESFGYSTS